MLLLSLAASLNFANPAPLVVLDLTVPDGTFRECDEVKPEDGAHFLRRLASRSESVVVLDEVSPSYECAQLLRVVTTKPGLFREFAEGRNYPIWEPALTGLSVEFFVNSDWKGSSPQSFYISDSQVALDFLYRVQGTRKLLRWLKAHGYADVVSSIRGNCILDGKLFLMRVTQHTARGDQVKLRHLTAKRYCDHEL